MRGWPPLEVAWLALALGLALIPLYSFTAGRRPAEVAVQVASTPTETTVATWCEAKFAHPPRSVRLSHGTTVLWEVVQPAGQTKLKGKIQLPIPPEGVDLRLEAAWPEGTPETAVELILEPEMLDGQSRTVWGSGQVNQTLDFVWPKP